MAFLTCNRGKTSYPIKDPLDRVTSMTSPAGTTNYHYDTTTGRLDKITSPEGKEFNYSYNHGQLSTLEYPNGITAHYAFDDNGNLTDLHYQKSGSTVKRYQYRYDKNGMRDTMIDNDGVHSYVYDQLYQITQATHPTAPNPLEQFSYDAVGNRLTDLTHTAYQYNELNQLLEDDSCKYLYDLEGNQTEKIDKTTGDTTHFVYDIENKLVQVQKAGMLAQYASDALGRRMSKMINGVSKHFRYDRDNLLLEMNGSDSVTTDYTFGPGIDNPLVMNRNGNYYFYVKDGLGSVTSLTDDEGNAKHEYGYMVFGKIVTESGDTTENRFTYTGRELDKETGNYYYRARYYDEQRGKYIQEDPLQILSGDLNLYRYVSNSPISFNDPKGLQIAYPLPNPYTLPITIGIGIGSAIITYGITHFPATPLQRTRDFPDVAPCNPGRDKCGKCNPCPPPLPVIEHPGDAHGSTGGSHSHWIVWNQDPKDCTCYPDRMSGDGPPPNFPGSGDK